MLISGVSDESEDSHEGQEMEHAAGHHEEYKTASELFDIMTRNQHFNTDDEDRLTTQDLILLYQNIDIGTKLMSSANERKKPNQYVETVIYNDGSDTESEVSLEDISSMFELNQERLNLFNNGSLDNILCHKLGGLQIRTSDLTTDYDRQFLFKDPYIKDQLKDFGHFGDLQSIVPTSLLDYICCKRLEDNYNFYMDNIIRYVTRTIEQLKRISNGDFLTERAKEKWKNVNGKDDQINKTKVLANSTSIPLHVECKKKGNAVKKWDDIIHSEMDVRSLSKILEKKIVVEIPKLICGSYRLFSKRCADNLIISCKREQENNKNEKESRLDVILQLKKSETGQVMSNISSIMILRNSREVQKVYTPRPPKILALPYNETLGTELSVINTTDNVTKNNINYSEDNVKDKVIMSDIKPEQEKSEKDSSFLSSDEYLSSFESNNIYSSESSIQTKSNELIEEPSKDSFFYDSAFIFTSPDELRVAMQRLNMQTVLPEETGEELTSNHLPKKKSLTRVRIKSPYENKSILMEEKKRKRFLEIREKRERKKQALGDCKISKTKYIKGNVPQPTNSVTKLSITNKSFYNSIYGQNEGSKSSKTTNKTFNYNIKKESPSLEVAEEQMQDEYESSNLTPDMNSKKYINRSYYLDEAETEMMYIEKKNAENKELKTGSASTSTVSNDFQSNLNLLNDLIDPSTITTSTSVTQVRSVTSCRSITQVETNKDSDKAPANTPKDDISNTNEPKSVPSTVECRKSIEKVYDLMKKLSNTNTEPKISLSKQMTSNGNSNAACSSTWQGSDSGTSLKHQLTSSDKNSFTFDKLALANQRLKTGNKKSGQSSMVVPKVIISSKVQEFRPDTVTITKDYKKPPSPKKSKSPRKPKSPQSTKSSLVDHPLKTITQLLNELEKQKNKQALDRSLKKVDIASSDLRNLKRGTKEVTFRRKSLIDQHLNTIKDKEQDRNKVLTPRERKMKSRSPEIAKIPHQQTPVDDKMIERITKKKLTDIMDEAKEARGEAVRGPPKFPSRLYTLAQPKKSYVQAHNEEYRNRSVKNIMMADRLQRLASTSPNGRKKVDNQSPNKPKSKRASTEGNGNTKLSVPVQTIEGKSASHRSNSSSPKSRSPAPAPVNYRRSGCESPRKSKWPVESYPTNQFRRRSRSPLSVNDLSLLGHKSRVPLIPEDLKQSSLSTPEAANELGNELHSIINSIVSSVPLETLNESLESNIDGISVMDERTDSDFNIDVFEDKYLETAVECCFDYKEKQTNVATDSFKPQDDIPLLSSKTEIELLENALCSHISGTFQKRLRIKNLTLTPKQSLQKVFLLQSGDAGRSLLVKSLTKLNINKCVAEGFNDLKAMPVLSNNHLNFNFMEIPMQISTVGYSISQQEPIDVTNLNISSFEGTNTTSKHSELNHCQCLTIVHQQQRLGQPMETYVEGDSTVVKTKIGTNVERNIEKKLNGIASIVTSEHRSKTGLNEVNASKEEQVVPTTKVARNDKNRLSKCSHSVTASVSMQSTNPDYTSSLDMLVGLLNEIKKITSENQVNNGCSDLDAMLCNAAKVEHMEQCRELVPVASLHQLKKLGSNASIYSLYISKAEDLNASNYSQDIPSDIMEKEVDKPVFVDKDVNVNIEKELVSVFTDVPSSSLPITMNHSTNMTNSLIGVISEPSSQSMFNFNEYHTLYSNKVFDTRSTKISEPILNGDRSEETTLANENFTKIKSSTKKRTKQKFVSPVRDICDHKLMRYHKSFGEFDPLLKVKRDILVTVYSILVFTVFAALSFPEMY